ncbi:MAG: hypothetical protein WDA75_06925 [Candidatus Latescibacterota bacterium]|jgi:hypothetical protein
MADPAPSRTLDHGHRRFRRCLLAALCLHLLLLVLLQWAMVRQQQAVLAAVRVRFETGPSGSWSGAPEPVPPEVGQNPFSLAPQPAAGPGGGPGGGAAGDGYPGLGGLPAFDGPASEYLLGSGDGGLGKGPWSARPEGELPSLAALDLASARQQMLAEARRRDGWFPEPDTNSAERQRRRRAEAIVDSGLERLRGLRGKEVTASVYDYKRERWVETGRSWYSQGRKLVTRQGDASLQGTDGYRDWSYLFGMPMPVASQSLQQQAERWDFLSQFRGSEIRLDYLGPLLLPGGGTCEGILVEDLKYGTRRRACFDPQTHLLTWVEEGGRREEMREYRREAGVLTPYETWTYVGRHVKRNRFETRYNPDPSELPVDPGPRTWESGEMQVLMHQPPAESRGVRFRELYQPRKPPFGVPLTPFSHRLLVFYLNQRLVSAQAGDPGYGSLLMDVEIRSFWRAGRPPPHPPLLSLDLVVLLIEPESSEVVWESTPYHYGWVEDAWQINDTRADDLTAAALDAAGTGLAALYQRDPVAR